MILEALEKALLWTSPKNILSIIYTPHWDFFIWVEKFVILGIGQQIFIGLVKKKDWITGLAFYRSIFLAISFLTNMNEI